MDKRIEQKLLELQLEEETSRLLQKRLISSTAELEAFMEENLEGIKRIFQLNKAKFVYFHNDRTNKELLCYGPEDGFHTRAYPIQRGGTEGPVTHDTEIKFKNIEELVTKFSEKNHPEELTDCFAQAFLNDQFHQE